MGPYHVSSGELCDEKQMRAFFKSGMIVIAPNIADLADTPDKSGLVALRDIADDRCLETRHRCPSLQPGAGLVPMTTLPPNDDSTWRA